MRSPAARLQVPDCSLMVAWTSLEEPMSDEVLDPQRALIHIMAIMAADREMIERAVRARHASA